MPLSTEPWGIDRHDKVAKIARSLSQDVGKRFRDEVLKKLYPEKKVKNKKGEKVDIGDICCTWAYTVLTSFDNENKIQDQLLKFIRLSYIDGINLDEDELWQDYMSIYGIGAFADKISKFAQIAKLSFMDKLDKKSVGRDVETVQW